MRISGRRCSALLVGAVLALSACDGGEGSPEPKPSTSSKAAAPALPVVSPGTTQGVPVAQVGTPAWTSTDKRIGLGRFRDAAVVDGVVVLTGEDGAAAVTARTGRVLWFHRFSSRSALPGTSTAYYSPFSVRGPIVVSEPVGRIGRVVLAGYSSLTDREGYGVMALSLRTGEVVWQRRFATNLNDLPELKVVGASARQVLVSATPRRSTLPAPASEARALALDTATGKQSWQRSGAIAQALTGDTAVLTAVTETQLSSFPAVSAGPIVGVDARTSKQRWRVPGVSTESVTQVRAPTDRTVVVGSDPSRLLDTSTGRTLWRSTDFSVCESDGRRVVVCTSEGHLVSWSTADPVVRRSAGRVVESPRLVEDGRVHLYSNYPAKVVDLSGSALLTSLAAPVVAGGSGFLVIEGKSAESGSGHQMIVRPVTAGR